MINWGNNTNAKIFDYGFGKYVIFTDTKIYVSLIDEVREFIIVHDLIKPEDEKTSFWQKLTNAIGKFVSEIWDGIQKIAGYIWSGLMWIGKILIEFAKFVWGVLVQFFDMLVVFFGDLIHNLSVLVYPFFIIAGPVLMMVVISYGSRLIYFDEE